MINYNDTYDNNIKSINYNLRHNGVIHEKVINFLFGNSIWRADT